MLTGEDLRCPICLTAFSISEEGHSLVCGKHHVYDVAKQGYVNFFGGNAQKMYRNSKELFKARRIIYEAGFFGGLQERMENLFHDLVSGEKKKILEIGCGEGTVSSFLAGKYPMHDFLGLDISRDAIKMAAQLNKKVNWIVGDMCNIPIKDNRIDCLIDMLAPANYLEFNRVLKSDAYIIKVVPNSGYLKEIREIVGLKPYVDKGVEKLFMQHFSLVERETVKYKFKCGMLARKYIYMMTPLANKIPYSKELERIETVTVDLDILVGHRKEDNGKWNSQK